MSRYELITSHLAGLRILKSADSHNGVRLDCCLYHRRSSLANSVPKLQRRLLRRYHLLGRVPAQCVPLSQKATPTSPARLWPLGTRIPLGTRPLLCAGQHRGGMSHHPSTRGSACLDGRVGSWISMHHDGAQARSQKIAGKADVRETWLVACRRARARIARITNRIFRIVAQSCFGGRCFFDMLVDLLSVPPAIRAPRSASPPSSPASRGAERTPRRYQPPLGRGLDTTFSRILRRRSSSLPTESPAGSAYSRESRRLYSKAHLPLLGLR
ncbi:hypothetical protein B0H11DRAFT_2245223 [Mycena galericulata]|nr:hypothetical protein B0H11DRAFT_2245223 [Mycena galericulata]